MPESLGARLRQQREKSGIALAAIAKQTRIKESLLEALERDDLSQWPNGFYRRAFFRAYAAAIQLDPDVAFSEFQSVHPEPPEADVMTAMAATLGRGDEQNRTALRNVVGSAISSLSRLRPATPVESAPPPQALPREVPEQPALEQLARLCVELGCVGSEDGARSLLQDAARLIGAGGLIVWAWNPRELHLQPALSHGYSPRVVAQLPMVRRGDNNATAAAFSTSQTRVFNDSASGKCAVVIPLRTTAGCVGVFAAELERGLEATASRVATATVVAAQLAPIVEKLSRPAQYQLPRAANNDIQTV
jgi:hypothetical protein